MGAPFGPGFTLYLCHNSIRGGMEIKRVAKDAAAILGAMRFTRYHRLYNEKQNGVYFMPNEHLMEDSLQTIDKFLKACVQSTANLAMKTANRVKTIPMHLFNFVKQLNLKK